MSKEYSAFVIRGEKGIGCFLFPRIRFIEARAAIHEYSQTCDTAIRLAFGYVFKFESVSASIDNLLRFHDLQGLPSYNLPVALTSGFSKTYSNIYKAMDAADKYN